MLWYVFCFTMILFFTQKQFSAAANFHGASGTAKMIIQISAFCGAAMWLSEVFCLVTEGSFFFAIGVVVTALLVTCILNKLVTRRVASRWERDNKGRFQSEGSEMLAWYSFDYECDLANTKIALVGIIVNPLLYYLRF